GCSRLGDPQLSVHVGAGVVVVGEDTDGAGRVVPRGTGMDGRRGELAAVGLDRPVDLPLVHPPDDRAQVGGLDLGIERRGGVVVVDVDLPDRLRGLRRGRGRRRRGGAGRLGGGGRHPCPGLGAGFGGRGGGVLGGGGGRRRRR